MDEQERAKMREEMQRCGMPEALQQRILNRTPEEWAQVRELGRCANLRTKIDRAQWLILTQGCSFAELEEFLNE